MLPGSISGPFNECRPTMRRLEQQRRLLERGHTKPSNGLFQSEPAPAMQPCTSHTTEVTEEIPYPLTKDEALTFLQKVLKIDNPETFMENDRIGFVDEYVHRMCTMLPFTNIVERSRRIDAEGTPSFKDCKEAIFQGHGGHCYYKNIFSKALLDLLGYTTFHVGGNNPGDELFDTHAAIIMKDLTSPGSIHLIESGTRRPIFRAIPLDFEEESPAYQFSFMTSKFFRRSHGRLAWCALHEKNGTESSEYVLKSKDGTLWKTQLTYRLDNPKPRAWFAKMANFRYGMPGVMPLAHQRTYVSGYKNDCMYLMAILRNTRGMKWIAVLIVKSEDPTKCLEAILTKEELVDKIVEVFPQFPREMVERAMENTEHGGNLYAV